MSMTPLLRCPVLRRCGLALGAALLWGAGQPAVAASQGSPGATSTGAYTLTITAPPAPRLVQITNLADVTIDQNSGPAEGRSGSFGASNRFCIVDTSGASVTLTVTSANGWLMRATTGQTVAYQFEITSPDLATSFGGSADGTSFTRPIPPAHLVTSASACGIGTLKKHAWLSALPVTGLTYNDVITMTVAPQ
jgi:hypothetical protein